MRKDALALAVLLFATYGIRAQEEPSPVPSAAANTPVIGPLAAPFELPARAIGFSEPADSPPRLSVWAEYLMWWSKAGPLSAPVLTAAPANAPFATAGYLGSPGTVSLFHGPSFPVQSGGRITGDYWFDRDDSLGLEASYLFLTRISSVQTAAASGAPGSAYLVNPIFDVAPGVHAPSGNYLASPPVGGFGASAGSAMLEGSTRLQGAELNLLGGRWRSPAANLVLLAGFRYLRLDEALAMTTTQLGFGKGSFPGQFVDTVDQFGTHNNFYGGQLGARWTLDRGRFFVSATGKVALGADSGSVAIDGFTTTNTGRGFATSIPVVTVPQGVYALPTNIGRQSHARFAVAPEVILQVGLNLTPNWRIFTGYDFLYISSVVRPGNQIDPGINPTQLPSFTGVPTGPLVGPARPAPQFNSSDFWAQGINFGIQYRW